eukprot:PhF_6_TR31518/c0_g1_i1/m.46448
MLSSLGIVLLLLVGVVVCELFTLTPNDALNVMTTPSRAFFGKSLAFDGVSTLLVSQPVDIVTSNQCSSSGTVHVYDFDITLGVGIYQSSILGSNIWNGTTCHLGQHVSVSRALATISDTTRVYVLSRDTISTWSLKLQVDGIHGAVYGRFAVVVGVSSTTLYQLSSATSQLTPLWTQQHTTVETTVYRAAIHNSVLAVVYRQAEYFQAVVMQYNTQTATVVKQINLRGMTLGNGATVTSLYFCDGSSLLIGVDMGGGRTMIVRVDISTWELVTLNSDCSTSMAASCYGKVTAVGCYSGDYVDLYDTTVSVTPYTRMKKSSGTLYGYSTVVLPNTWVVSSAVQQNNSVGAVYGNSLQCMRKQLSCKNGVCSDDGTSCVCSQRWAGTTCEKCAGGYFGATCSLECQGNKVYDIPTAQCVCARTASKGYWDGPDCSLCLSGYVGTSCNASCGCNDHGTCTTPNVCTCYSDPAAGYWDGPACAWCKSQYTGSSCTITCGYDNGKLCGGHGQCQIRNGYPTCVCFGSDSDGYFSGSTCSMCAKGYLLDNGCKPEPDASGPFIIAAATLFGLVCLIIVCFIPFRLFMHRRHMQRMRALQLANMEGTNPTGDGTAPAPQGVVPPRSEDSIRYEEDLETILEPSRQIRESIEEKGGAVPRELMCPITSELFVDPVVTADGHTYERIAILQWFKKKQTSPVTNLPVDASIIVPNNTVRSQVVAFREQFMQKAETAPFGNEGEPSPQNDAVVATAALPASVS